MRNRRLTFVNHATEAPSPRVSTDIIILDTSWTPTESDRTDLRPVRATVHEVLARAELYGELEAGLVAWADATGAVDRFAIGGTSWWYRVRMLLLWDLHERMIWSYVLDELATTDHSHIEVPGDRSALIDASQAFAASRLGVTVDVIETTIEAPAQPAWTPRRAIRRFRRRVWRRLGHPPKSSARKTMIAQRRAILDARLGTLAEQPGSVLVVASARAFQVVTENGTDRAVEPFLEPVLQELTARGTSTVTVMLTADHRDDADWRLLAEEERAIPQSMIQARRPEDEGAAKETIELAPGLDDLKVPPIVVAGTDLGPSILALARGYSGEWLVNQARWTRSAEALMRALRPSLVFLDREDSRLTWLVAAARLGIPVVAVQHGLIYPGHLGYKVHRPAGVSRPDLTCVFGRYERDVLLTSGLFPVSSVIVTGSPRIDPGLGVRASSASEREDVRNELGVGPDLRMLVVSVTHNPVAGDIYSVEMVARLLGAPMPGIHVVFKLHPLERATPPYEAVLDGLARAGGYEPPPMTSVRDIDLYRLLRAADAHLGLYSTVLTDAVVVGVPNLIAAGQAFGDLLGYVPAGVAEPVTSPNEVLAFMADPRPPDPARREAFLAAHFEPGDAAGRVADAIGRLIDLR